ncbi:RiPP maturation radical SAM C-methyltransferase [Streptomyces sp. G44]|uniref:RiPP maturation radical SAM C-methyltransferase n=1 Tax=Streptomyces sp. G44 TaxID=2807632 RepID=UPI0027DC7A1F|nr:RiPP maturation radical SAM C-methyltransferase [Streptomyces sp. G44]
MSLPWQLLDLPSLAVGILTRRVRQVRPDDTVLEVHGALRWADHLYTASGGELSAADYAEIAEHGLHHGIGDWIFAGALYDDPSWRRGQFTAYAERVHLDDRLSRLATRMRHCAADFVEAVAGDLARARPDVVGFTTTFMQNVPSLAVARRLKQLLPAVRTVMGGANCDGPMGRALHRNHRFVDYAVRGEGEVAFPALLDHIAAGTPPRDVPGVCWWDGHRPVANAQPAGVVAPGLIPVPDYAAWHRAVEESASRPYLEPQLVLEGARGCWWGEKHQCTFCGLNGSAIGFRSKPAEQLWAEIGEVVRSHRILDLVMVDNIIDMRYFEDLLPRLAASGWDLRVHYEVKSNLKAEQIRRLVEACVVHLQPGIESLNSRVLQLMDKGVSGARNVRTLRDCQQAGATVDWNYLYGFPGEREQDYRPILRQMPALAHLQPPADATRIALERFSPYFERPELGFPHRTPASFYQHVYDLPEAELADLAYLFDTPAQGITGRTEATLHECVRQWRAAHPHSSLLLTGQDTDRYVIHDRRHGWPERDHTLTGWQAAAYHLLEPGRTPAALTRALAEAGHPVPGQDTSAWLRRMLRHGLVFEDGNQYVTLAHPVTPVRVRPDDPIPVPVPVGTSS